MRIIILIIFSFLVINVSKAQLTASNLIDGSRTLVELISVFKKSKPATLMPVDKNAVDSCAIKQLADLCFKNSSSTDIAISLYRRVETAYEAQPFTVKVLPRKEECLYELKSGIYKYRIEVEKSGVKNVLNEGEFKLQPCDNMKREIKE